MHKIIQLGPDLKVPDAASTLRHAYKDLPPAVLDPWVTDRSADGHAGNFPSLEATAKLYLLHGTRDVLSRGVGQQHRLARPLWAVILGALIPCAWYD